MTKEEISAFVMALRDIRTSLTPADAKLKAEVFADLGVRTSFLGDPTAAKRKLCGHM